ncbi:enoyl-CoA hydratase [Lipingzhangella halophila]|uniref:enoyl-CoA hydratase n=1 Tax=Lipingzhangella halophila TaxID=1783352 RepID=A0A7W7RGA9_9ACTN|nr:enoyl-CoA hydratase-related protein [Lipingzhangella halophila]MBB4930896.1 enoyl-CoA hydratase [Lipingzhangella halophila]
MDNYETLTVRVDNGLGMITIDRPEVRNALSGQVVSEIRRALERFSEDDEVGAVAFTGAGAKSFAAGADISEVRERTVADGLAARMQRLYDEIEEYEKPTIAAVNGVALGGGCELAMACDIRVSADNAKFGLPEATLSIIPGAGGTQRLSRLVGKGRALDLILTGRIITAEEAANIGLVSRSVPGDQLTSALRETADAVLAKGPLAVRLAKIAVGQGSETDQKTGLLLERLAQAVLFTTEDKREGATAFLEKRRPAFKGR